MTHGGKKAKPALGAPHDSYATVGITLAVAASYFFTGHTHVEADAVGWTGMFASYAVVIALLYYFQRAYGFASRGWGGAPMGAVLAAIFGFLVVLQFVPAALYEQYFYDSLLAYSMASLGLAMLAVGTLRAALGKPAPAGTTSP